MSQIPDSAIAKLLADLKHGEDMYIAMRDRCARTEKMLSKAEADNKALLEALKLIAEHEGKTLFRADPDTRLPYTEGTNAAFNQLAGIARAALEQAGQ